MASISMRRLGFVITTAVILTGLLTWRLQASGLMVTMFDSSSPVSPIKTPTPVPLPSPAAPPIIMRVAPDHGDNAAPNRVAIHGAYFQGQPQVTIGAFPLEQVHRENHTLLLGKVPAGLPPGAYPVSVCNPDKQCAALAAAFTVTDARPILTGIVPAQGQNTAPNEVTIYGFNLRPGLALQIGAAPLVDVTWASAGEARAIIPAGLSPGVYDLTASNPGVSEAARLPGGYTVLDPDAEDLFVTAADIWTDPATLRQGEPPAARLGANIHRQGGAAVRSVQARFYLGDPEAGGIPLGDAVTAPMAPAANTVEPVSIPWNPGARVGSAAIYVVVDPAGQVAEANEANNLARRDLLILPPAPDAAPPAITGFSVNQGSQSTGDPALQVAIQATDDRSGIYSLYLIERTFNAAANMWVAAQHSGWLPFQGVYTFTLTSPGGVRYLQAWVADAAGNVTPLPAQARINYLPPRDTVLADQTRVFRFALAQGQGFTATLNTLNVEGDADLYLWGPAGAGGWPLWISNQAGAAEDRLSITAAAAGDYDIEVHGWNSRSEYHLSVAAEPQRGVAAAHAADKPVPEAPAGAAVTAPEDRTGLPAAPIAPPGKVRLPLVMASVRAAPPKSPYPIYLPALLYSAAAPAPQHKIALPLISG